MLAGMALIVLLGAPLCGADVVPDVTVERGIIPDGVQLVRDLVYVAGGHPRNKLDLYLPEKAQRTPPLIVFIHGGSWQKGDKFPNPIASFATKGFAVAAINYRFSQDAIFPAQIEDCKAAIRWLRANAAQNGYDAQRIGVWGTSAGAYLAALLGTTAGERDLEGHGGNQEQSSRVQAVVDYFGPTNLATIPPRPNRAALIGGSPREHPERAARASPVSYVTKDDAPFLIVHGEEDDQVPMSQSLELLDGLTRCGVEAALIRVPGGKHLGKAKIYFTPALLSTIEGFFRRHLRP